MAVLPWFEQEAGVVHGGVIGAIADTASAYAIGPTARIGVEYKISFLRSAAMNDEPLIARGRVVRRGKRVSVASVDVFQGESHLATGLFTYLMK